MNKTILLICLVFSTLSHSQIKFEPGYFITNDGKKTECLIQNWAWRNNPVEFQYVFSEGETAQKATIQEIREFNINNVYKYKRYTVQIDMSPTELEELNTNRQPLFATKTAFLKVLVEGRVNLYQYEQNGHSKYFISTGNHENAEQLIYKEFLISSRVAKNNHFKQQLYESFKSEKVTADDFKDLKYQKKALVEVVSKFNGEDGKQSTNFETLHNKTIITTKVTAGIGLTTIKSQDINGIMPYKGTDPSIRLGIEIEGTLPFNNNKWSLFADPNVTFFKNKGMSGNYNIEVKFNYIQIPVGLRHYMFLDNSSKLFLTGGISFLLPMDSEISYYQTGNKPVNVEIAKSTTGFAGVGYDYRKISVELRYNFTHGLTVEPTYVANHTLLAAIVGYKF